MSNWTTAQLEELLEPKPVLRRMKRWNSRPLRMTVRKETSEFNIANGKGATISVEWKDGTVLGTYTNNYLLFGSWVALRRKWGEAQEQTLVEDGIYVGVELTWGGVADNTPTPKLDEMLAIVWGR